MGRDCPLPLAKGKEKGAVPLIRFKKLGPQMRILVNSSALLMNIEQTRNFK